MGAELRLALTQDIVDALLAKHPEAEVEILNRIIATTGTRIIKKALNDQDLLTAVQALVEKAVTNLALEVGVEMKGPRDVYGRLTPRVTQALRDQVLPMVYDLVNQAVAKHAEERLSVERRLNDYIVLTVNQQVRRLFNEDLKAEYQARFDAAVDRALQKRLGLTPAGA